MQAGSLRSRMASRCFGVWALLAALAIACGCGWGAAPSRSDEASPSWPGREDAGPYFYPEREVDVPARPVAPLEPAYPPELRALGVEGDVEVRVAVFSDGSVGGARLVESTHDDFTVAVREALRGARFHPGLRRGKPVSSWVTLRLHFRLGE